MTNKQKTLRRLLRIFIAALFISGLTAIPAETELQFLCRVFPPGTAAGNWLDKIYTGLQDTNAQYPFLSYGYDWLAFAHFVLAILFTGPLRDPVKNRWVIEFGMIACLLVIPFALVAGHFRNIPLWWRLADCSFGVLGFILLFICIRLINQLEKGQTTGTF